MSHFQGTRHPQSPEYGSLTEGYNGTRHQKYSSEHLCSTSASAFKANTYPSVILSPTQRSAPTRMRSSRIVHNSRAPCGSATDSSPAADSRPGGRITSTTPLLRLIAIYSVLVTCYCPSNTYHRPLGSIHESQNTVCKLLACYSSTIPAAGYIHLLIPLRLGIQSFEAASGITNKHPSLRDVGRYVALCHIQMWVEAKQNLRALLLVNVSKRRLSRTGSTKAYLDNTYLI